MTNPISNQSKPITYDFNDKPVYPNQEKIVKTIPYDQKKIVEIIEFSLCSTGEISRPLRSSATDIIALPKGASSDDDMEGKPPVSDR